VYIKQMFKRFLLYNINRCTVPWGQRWMLKNWGKNWYSFIPAN